MTADRDADDRAGDGEQDDASGHEGHGGASDEHHTNGHDGHDHGGHHARDVESVSAAVVTVSSTRTPENDPGGDAVEAALTDAGHDVVTRTAVTDEYDTIQSRVDDLVTENGVDVVVTTGGTGVTPDDVTVEAVRPLLEKRLPGFGELFRSLSYDEVGSRVVGTRATAGVADEIVVFCLPGSENAARLGAERIIAPEVGHLAGLAHRPEDGADGADEADGGANAGDGAGENGDGAGENGDGAGENGGRADEAGDTDG